MQAAFVIHQQEKYYGFIFTTEEQSPMLLSRLFKTKDLCKRAIRELIISAAVATNFEKVEDGTGAFSFNLKDGKGNIIAYSRVFYAKSSRDYAIRQVVHQCGKAVTKELPSTATFCTTSGVLSHN